MATPVKSADQYILQDFVPLLENIIISKENEAKKTEQILKKIKSIPKNLETSFVFGWLYIRFYDLAYSIAKTKDQLKATAKRKVFSDIILNHLKFIYSEFGQTAQAEQLKKYGSGNGYYKFLEFSIIGTKITIELERFTIHSKSRSKQETGKSGNEFYRLFTKDGAEALKTILDQKYGKGTGKREALLNYIASIIALEDVKVFLSELKKINSVNFNFIKDEFSEKGISNILIPNLEKRLQILNANTEFLISKGIVKAEDPSQLKSSIEKDIPVERTTRMTIDSIGYQIGSKVDQKTKAHPFYDLPSIKKQTYYTDGGNPVTLYLLFLKEIGITNEEYNELEEIFNSEQFDEFLITRILTDIEIYKNFNS